MTKDPLVYLDHFSQFLDSIPVQDITLRRVQIIGQAIKSLPQSIKVKFPEVAWKEIAGMRDKLVHDYMEIDFELTWEVVQRDIPILKKQIMEIKKDLASL